MSGISFIYSGQSGSLEESTADLFAELLDCQTQSNWIMGLDAFNNECKAGWIRNLRAPHTLGNPEHMDRYNPWLGVHYNSAIPSLAAYLTVEGGTHNGITVNGLGLTKTEQLYFTTIFDIRLTASASFYDYRDVILEVCKWMNENNLNGITIADCLDVYKAWASVGLGDITQTVCATINEDQDRFGYSLASGDFDGDYYDDLAVGIPSEGFEEYQDGLVVVLYGSDFGISWPDTVEIIDQENPRIGLKNQNFDRFGEILVTGNFNGDGRDDLAIGMPYENVEKKNDGMVLVLYGTNQGLIRDTSGLIAIGSAIEKIHQESLGINGINEKNDQFGTTLVRGDFDGDDYDHLAIGSPKENQFKENDGIVVIIYGSWMGLIPDMGYVVEGGTTGGMVPPRVDRIHQETPGVNGLNEKNDKFGTTLSSGDFNGDGYDDLVIGVPYENVEKTNDGMVYVLFGGSSGILDSGIAMAQQIHQGLAVIPGFNKKSDRFGWSLACGDFDGDGFDDLAVGIPYKTVEKYNDGRIIVIYGTLGGLVGPVGMTLIESIDQESPMVGGENEYSDRFGWTLLSTEINGDICHDLVVGIPYEGHSGRGQNGEVIVLSGSSTGLLSVNALHITQSDIGGQEEKKDRFGFALTSGNFDGDPQVELAISAPWEDVHRRINTGAIYVWEG
jgi:hypothetical protein